MEKSIILHDPDIRRRCDYTKYVAVIDRYRSAIRIRIDQKIAMKYNAVANSLEGKGLVNTRACLFSPVNRTLIQDLQMKKRSNAGTLERPLTLNNNDYWPITYFSNHHG